MMHLVVEDPSPCEDCEGSRTLPLYEYDHLGELQIIDRRPCSACCCESCGQPTDTSPFCERCDRNQKEETWPTPKTPPGPMTSPRTLGEPTATPTPQTPAGSATQPEGERP